MTGLYRKLHNEDLHNLYLSADVVDEIKDEMGETRSVQKR
jgi:hypothetical protein